jgi:hypothetical protein
MATAWSDYGAEMRFLNWLQSLAISDWITTSDFGFPIMLSLHSIGLSVVVGIQLMLALRVLGFAAQAPLAAFARYIPLAWLGFAINAISGSLMFMADARRLIVNWPFLVKMSCVAAGGVIAALLWRQLRIAGRELPMPTTTSSTPAFAVDSHARLLAGLTIAIWVGAIAFGRMIAYVMDRALLHGELK